MAQETLPSQDETSFPARFKDWVDRAKENSDANDEDVISYVSENLSRFLSPGKLAEARGIESDDLKIAQHLFSRYVSTEIKEEEAPPLVPRRSFQRRPIPEMTYHQKLNLVSGLYRLQLQEEEERKKKHQLHLETENAKYHRNILEEASLFSGKEDVDRFFRGELRLDPDRLKQAANLLISINESKEKGKPFVAPDELSPEDQYLKGIPADSSSFDKALGAVQIGATILAPAGMAAYFLAGQIANLHNEFRGYAVLDPKFLEDRISRLPKDQTPQERRQERDRQLAVEYYITENPFEAIRLHQRLHQRYLGEKESDLPPFEIEKIPKANFLGLSVEKLKLSGVEGLPFVFRLSGPKTLGEAASSLMKGGLSLGVGSETVGQGISKALIASGGTLEDSEIMGQVADVLTIGLTLKPGPGLTRSDLRGVFNRTKRQAILEKGRLETPLADDIENLVKTSPPSRAVVKLVDSGAVSLHDADKLVPLIESGKRGEDLLKVLRERKILTPEEFSIEQRLAQAFPEKVSQLFDMPKRVSELIRGAAPTIADDIDALSVGIKPRRVKKIELPKAPPLSAKFFGELKTAYETVAEKLGKTELEKIFFEGNIDPSLIDKSVARPFSTTYFWLLNKYGDVVKKARGEKIPSKIFQNLELPKTPEKDLGIFSFALGTPSNGLSRIVNFSKPIEQVNLAEIGLLKKNAIDAGEAMRVYLGLPKELRRDASKVFVDMFEGRSISQIQNEFPNLPSEIYEQANRLSHLFQKWSHEITSRQAVFDPTIDPSRWGVQLGYFPRVYKGQFRIHFPDVELYGGRFTEVVANTFQEAAEKVDELKAIYPDLKHHKFKIEHNSPNLDAFQLLTPRLQKKAVELLARDLEVPPDIVQEVFREMSPPIGKRAPFFLKRRVKELGGSFERDYFSAMNSYIRAKNRYLYITPLREMVEETVLRTQTAQPLAAKKLKFAFDRVSGGQSISSELFDKFLAGLFGAGRISPRTLDRWSSYWRSGVSTAFLATPRFALVNSTQPLETLWPIASMSEVVNARSWMKSTQGKEILKRYNADGLISKFYLESPSFSGLAKGPTRFLFGPENFNSKLAFSTMFQKGIASGMSEEAAANYAFLRGQLFTQYINLLSDQPFWTSGPLLSVFGQFKRFSVKNTEQMIDFVRDKNFPAAMKFLAAKGALGGLRSYMKFETYNELKESMKEDYGAVGNKIADSLYFGMGGFLGIDLTSSYLLFQVPRGNSFAEKLQNFALGPSLGSIHDVYLEMMKDDSGVLPTITPDGEVIDKPATFQKGWSALSRKIPTLKILAKLAHLSLKELDLESPSGKKVFEDDFISIAKNLGGFTDIRQTQARQIVNTAWEVQKKKSELIKRARVAFIRGALLDEPKHFDEAMAEIQRFQSLYPEIPMDIRFEVGRYLRDLSARDTTALGDLMNKIDKDMRPYVFKLIEDFDLQSQLWDNLSKEENNESTHE